MALAGSWTSSRAPALYRCAFFYTGLVLTQMGEEGSPGPATLPPGTGGGKYLLMRGAGLFSVRRRVFKKNLTFYCDLIILKCACCKVFFLVSKGGLPYGTFSPDGPII